MLEGLVSDIDQACKIILERTKMCLITLVVNDVSLFLNSKMIQVVQNNHIVHRDQKGHHHSIYSLDFQSGGSRLATGGGGKERIYYQIIVSYVFRWDRSSLAP